MMQAHLAVQEIKNKLILQILEFEQMQKRRTKEHFNMPEYYRASFNVKEGLIWHNLAHIETATLTRM